MKRVLFTFRIPQLLLAILLSLAVLFPSSFGISKTAVQIPDLFPGQSSIQLPDGQWLLVGGEGTDGAPVAAASIWDPRSSQLLALGSLQRSRAWHTATMLPDGTIFILGGVGSGGEVLSSPEIFNPASQSFELLPDVCCLVPRGRHTATLLTDGHVLITGGIGAGGEMLTSAQLYNSFQSSSVNLPPLSTARRNHSATLLANGNVLLWGGVDAAGNPIDSGEVLNPSTLQFSQISPSEIENLKSAIQSPYLAASLPVDGSTDIPTDSILSLRFSKPLRVETVNSQTVTLSGPKGVEAIKVVPTEGGLLAFVTPEQPLLPGSIYSLTVNGAVDRDGLLLPLSGLSFTTKGSAGSAQTADGGSQSSAPTAEPSSSTSPSASRLTPNQDDDWEWKGARKNGKPHSDWQDLPPLQANPGVTALAGQVLDLRGRPLANVRLVMEGMYGYEMVTATTDESGRFLLTDVMSGWCEFIIDGRVARRRVNPNNSSLGPAENHGVFEYGLEIKQGETNVLPFTIWLPKIDTAHAVKIPSPTSTEVIVTSPKIPGLELRIPPNTVIQDYEGGVVTEVGLTPIPLDRTPFPLPRNVDVPLYFTAQPGAAYLRTYGNIGARIHYPNRVNQLPGTRFEFWHYDPGYRGWYIYGLGTVQEDGQQIIPDPGVSVYEFTGAMVGSPPLAPPEGPLCPWDSECDDGDPVNLATGLFVLNKTDLFLPDAIMPIKFTRTYRPRDTRSRAFGIGASHSYDLFLVGDVFPYTFQDLILPDGARIHYDRISPGTSWTDAVYEHISTGTRFHKSTISWNGNGWDLKLKDGTLYVFREGFNASRPGQSGIIAIRDRSGNATTITRDANGNVTQITSPSGRWIEITSDSSNRITQAKDNIGRTVNYGYDATGRLIRVTDPNGGITEYTYDASSRMLTIKDARGIVFLTNEYDSIGRVIKQTQADGSTYQFAYTTDGGGKIIQTDVTDPRGHIRRVTFNASGYILTDTRAVGTPQAQTLTYERQAGTNFVLSRADALNRRTEYTYDSKGNVTSLKRLAGTPDAVTINYTYEPTFNQVASVTDPLNHTTTFAYDGKGNLTGVTNALNQTATLTYNTSGQPVSLTDPLNNTTQFTYEFGDLVGVTDPLANSTARFIDGAGRLAGLTNALGHLTRYDYDPLNRLTQVIDPLNGVTGFSYDPNGNLLTVRDARNNVTSYAYNSMDRLESRTDPLLRAESYLYDNNGNLRQFTDRKNQTATYTYDALNRRISATYADLSSTTYTYDAGNRLIQINDSVSGLITRNYDGLDRLLQETTPQGSVTYTYDDAGRRTSMTVLGQPTVNYAYDNANRLIQITKGSSIVSFTYDAVGRRSSLTLPNGILVEYTYDAASRLTGITYKKDTTVLGDLTYEYDKAGNRIKTGGSFARTGVPEAIASAAYNAANQQTALGDKTLTYDNNGNLLSVTDPSGTTNYTWNARNQLTDINGPSVTASFVYDGLGRRQQKTISGNSTEFLYDGVNPVQELSGASILANILPGLGIDEFLAREDVVAGLTDYFLPDALGSAIALADSAGTVQTEYAYEPFGRTTASGTSSTNPFQYTVRENDGTGLYYYRARYYHPQLQRFLGEDPMRFDMEIGGVGSSVRSPCPRSTRLTKLSENLYAYVANSPIMFSDPAGLDKTPPECPEPRGPQIGTAGCIRCDFSPLSLACYAQAAAASISCGSCVIGLIWSYGKYAPPECADCVANVGGTLGCLNEVCDYYTVPVHAGEHTSGLCKCRAL